MYKLYLNKGTRIEIDESDNEMDLVGTMADYIAKDQEARFIVKRQSKELGDSIRSINGLLEYALYIEELNSKNEEKIFKK